MVAITFAVNYRKCCRFFETPFITMLGLGIPLAKKNSEKLSNTLTHVPHALIISELKIIVPVDPDRLAR